MSTKIFPFRRYNPGKGRAGTALPDPPQPNQTDRRIMRELMAEQAALALDKRAAALPEATAKPEPVPVAVWGFEPELVIAFDTISSRRGRRRYRPAKRRALTEAVDFLRRFRLGETFACEACKTDITTKERGGKRVPYGVFVWEQPGEINASGLCRRCAKTIRVASTGATDDGKACAVKVMEWMATAGKGPDRDD